MNEEKLAQVKLDKPVSLGGQTFDAGSSVIDLVRVGRDEKVTVLVLSAVLDALGAQTQSVYRCLRERS